MSSGRNDFLSPSLRQWSCNSLLEKKFQADQLIRCIFLLKVTSHILCFLISRGTPNQHGYHLLQAMRFSVEEINNHTGEKPLLPGVTLGYQLYDSCSVSAAILNTLKVLELHLQPGNSSRVIGVIGPDSSSKSFTPAALLGSYLIPQVGSTWWPSCPVQGVFI